MWGGASKRFPLLLRSGIDLQNLNNWIELQNYGYMQLLVKNQRLPYPNPTESNPAEARTARNHDDLATAIGRLPRLRYQMVPVRGKDQRNASQ